MIIGADFTHMALTNTETNPFWEFSLAIYAQPGVQSACLKLQETQAVDVNVLLYVCWCAWEGRVLEASDLAAVDAAIAAWRRDVVWPIRALRQGLRNYPGVETSYQMIKQAELEAERVQQGRMYAHSESIQFTSEQGCLPQNLASFLAFHGGDNETLYGFQQLLLAAFRTVRIGRLNDD
jgi:uncharacterized protein (TIGR02444 family)